MTQVKICGIGRLDQALSAAQAGADYVGLVFVPERRRRITPAAAREIVVGLRQAGQNPPKVVGLFAAQPLAEVAQTATGCGLDLAQLCGGESLDYCNQLRSQAGIDIIRVVHVPDNAAQDAASLSQTIQEFRAQGHLVTLDRLVDGLQGGTGQSFDWDTAAQLARQGIDFFLAGGLTPDNVARAVAGVRPWGVDVSTGVETDGVKDPGKIRAFIKNAKTGAL